MKFIKKIIKKLIMKLIMKLICNVVHYGFLWIGDQAQTFSCSSRRSLHKAIKTGARCGGSSKAEDILRYRGVTWSHAVSPPPTARSVCVNNADTADTSARSEWILLLVLRAK